MPRYLREFDALRPGLGENDSRVGGQRDLMREKLVRTNTFAVEAYMFRTTMM